jgi:VIT1/CCC1 family predicted Fe2+/Mn2+ transporter
LTQKASAVSVARLRRVTGDRVLRAGVVVTVIGLIFTLIALIPLVIPSVELPGVWWFLAMITGVGLAIVILGLVMSARERRPR